MANHRQRYGRFAAQLAEVGIIASGTFIQLSTHCSTPNCRLHTNPPQLHSPLPPTDNQGGRQDRHTRRLTDRNDALYTEWTVNNQRIRQLHHTDMCNQRSCS
ncbi:DUF6788 family protein [Mycobacterium lepromatosis]|uniref:DUF6788 family protein n=1 Tax=Mycobacterium lepromatosis TaxID=480418 RepID=UPI003B50381B